MNLHLLMRRLRGKPTCIRDRSTRIGPRARIFNIGQHDGCIRIGAHSVIDGDLLVFAHGGEIRIGQWCFVGEGTRIWSGAKIEIGDRVLIAHNVNIFDNQTHPIHPVDRHAHFRAIVERGHPRDIDLGDRPVRIENDAWLGAGCCVLRGVTVGHGAIVAAGAVVTADVPPMMVVAGNPARVVRQVDDRPSRPAPTAVPA